MANLAAPAEKKRTNSIWLIAQGGKPVSDDYELGRQLGEPGQFGRAVVAIHKKSKEQFACKIISKIKFSRYESGLEQLKREIEIMKKLKHDNLIRFQDVYEDKENLYIVMEMCTGGELFERIQSQGAYNEKDASRLLRQLFLGVLHMHKHGIAHCDLKPDNFLLTTPAADAPIKIIDFGLSKFIKHRQYFTKFVGTPYYVAPEVLAGHYNESCDVWSLGVVMFVMLFGYPPFYADARKWGTQTDRKIFQLIRKGFDPVVKAGYGPHFPSAIPISDSARDLIAKLLVPSPKRPTAEEALNHAWLKGDGATATDLDPLVIKGLREFTAQTKFKQAVLRLMTDMLNEDEVANLKKTFAEMDENGDGHISVAELKNSLARLNKRPAENADVIAIIQHADIDGDGKIDYNELMSTFVDRKLNAKEERMFVAFSKLDQNGDGRISAEELEGVLKKEQVFKADDHESVAKLLKEADKDGDGKIDYEEFLSIMWAQSHPEGEDALDDSGETKKPETTAAAGKAAGKAATVVSAKSATVVAPSSSSSSSSSSSAAKSEPMAVVSPTDNNAQVVMTRTINTGRTATILRFFTWAVLAGVLASFILALALRLWFDDGTTNCGIWSCCSSGGCGTINESSLSSDELNKLRTVRAFIILGFVVSLLSLAMATLAYCANQDLLARYLAPLQGVCVIFSVISFAVYLDVADSLSVKDHLGAGFGFAVLAGILAFVGAASASCASRSLVVTNHSG